MPTNGPAAAGRTGARQHAANIGGAAGARPALPAALRILRQLVMARTHRAGLLRPGAAGHHHPGNDRAGRVALDQACRQARAELDNRHGHPCGPEGQPVEFWIIGMGKLGANSTCPVTST